MLRLILMALWLPRILLFVARLSVTVDERSLPESLRKMTPDRPVNRFRLTAPETARVIWNVLRWESGRFNNGCFVRSFTRYRFFRLMGYPVRYHLGVERKAGGAADTDLRSHAWLTLEGAPFLEFEPERFAGYRELYRYPEAG